MNRRAGFGEFGALPPKLDRETVRGTVSRNPRYDVVVDTAQFLMGTKQDSKQVVEKKILAPRPRKRLAHASLFQ